MAIISFIIRHGEKALHHEYVVALLNDLFGIQARGGCSCAGPYGHSLLNIDLQQSREFEKVVADGVNGMKPGWTRIGFNYFFSQETVDYIIEAVNLIADHGWKLLPLYSFNEKTGLWCHMAAADLPEPKLGGAFNGTIADRPASGKNSYQDIDFDLLLTEAKRLFNQAPALSSPDQVQEILLPEQCERLRWFATPRESLSRLQYGH